MVSNLEVEEVIVDHIHMVEENVFKEEDNNDRLIIIKEEEINVDVLAGFLNYNFY
jgi:hypothetical protein